MTIESVVNYCYCNRLRISEQKLATFRRKNRGQNRETTQAAGGIPCKNEDFVAQRPDLDGTDAKLLMMRSNYQEFIVD